MAEKWYRIGEVAQRSGLSVRALHHYDAIGLLSPRTRTASGHRLYGVRDLERLEQILVYRQLGFPLEDIRRVLGSGETDLAALLRVRLGQLEEGIREQQCQLYRLEQIVTRLESGEILTAGDLMEAIEVTAMFERHYSKDQLETLAERQREFGEERLAEVQEEWRTLFEMLDEARRSNIDPAATSLQPLAEKARSLLVMFSGGDAGIEQALQRMAAAEPDEMFRMWGVSPELGRYYLAVMQAHFNR